MKKFCALLFSVIIGFYANANPIVVKPFGVSELYFDEQGKWKLEISYDFANLFGITIDSAYLSSSTHSVKLPWYEFEEEVGVFVITADSIDTEFHIGRYADTITLATYTDEGQFMDWLIFGDIPDAHTDFPRDGQSIANVHIASGLITQDIFSKDSSPTIGLPNDTLGMCGTLKGIIYDKDMNPVKNRTFALDFDFKTNTRGEYSVRVLSKPTTSSTIFYEVEQSFFHYAYTEKYAYTMEPDSTVELNIYLLDSLMSVPGNTGILYNPISVYPNPVPKNGKLIIDIDLPVNTSDIYVEIIDLKGAIIRKKKINQSESSITAPSISGVYIVRTMLDSKTISSHKIIVND